MKKIYEKNELTFALMWIGIYCVVQSLCNSLNEVIGVGYSASAVCCIAQAAVLLAFIRKNGLQQRMGLCAPAAPARRLLYYAPLLIVMTRNLWDGAFATRPWEEVVCHIACMLGVGFVEEIIFRGFLFRAMEKSNRRAAIIVSSITFGLGHLVNLVNGSGAGLAENLYQVVGAMALGFMFVVLLDRGGSLLPCIAAHIVINVTSGFASEAGTAPALRLAFNTALIVISVSYALYLLKAIPAKEQAPDLEKVAQ